MKPPQGSRTPVVLGALLTLFQAAAVENGTLEGLQIIDGARAAEDLTDDVLLVAPSESPDDPAVTVRRFPQPSLGKHVYVEQTHVTMALSCYTGDTDMSVRRARAAGLFNAIATIVREHRTSEDEWDNLFLGEDEAWYQVQSGSGAVAAVGFTLVAEAIV